MKQKKLLSLVAVSFFISGIPTLTTPSDWSASSIINNCHIPSALGAAALSALTTAIVARQAYKEPSLQQHLHKLTQPLTEIFKKLDTAESIHRSARLTFGNQIPLEKTVQATTNLINAGPDLIRKAKDNPEIAKEIEKALKQAHACRDLIVSSPLFEQETRVQKKREQTAALAAKNIERSLTLQERNASLAEREQALKELQNEGLYRLRRENNSLHKKIHGLNQQIFELNIQIAANQLTIKNLESNNNNLQSAINNGTSQMGRVVQTANERHGKVVEEMGQHAQQLTRTLSEKDALLKKVTEQRDQLQKQLTSKENELKITLNLLQKVQSDAPPAYEPPHDPAPPYPGGK